MSVHGQINLIGSRPLDCDADFWRVRALLQETYPQVPLGLNWDVRRWDGSRFHHEADDWLARFTGRIQMWEIAKERLIGMVNPDGEGEAHLQVHPKFRTIEAEMVAWAEARLAAPRAEGGRSLEIFVYDYDAQRQELLQSRGYIQTAARGVVRRLRLAEHAFELPALAPGYTLRTTQPADTDTCQRIADLLNAAFNRDFHTALEVQNFVRQAPCFRPELDLVAEASDGSFAAYVGIAYDAPNRHAVFEPVCTHPAHRRKGLARALMLEGLLRLRALGAADVSVDTGDMLPANELYDSIGFTEVAWGHVWRKAF